jgi:hypothetical protein
LSREVSLENRLRLAHVPEKWLRFSEKDMRERKKLELLPVLNREEF